MQPEDINQENHQMDIEAPLFVTSPQLRLGYVTFNRNRNPINKRIDQALNYLQSFYTREFVKKSIQKIFVDKKPSHYSPQKIEEIKINSQKYFPLESIFDYHVHLISQTTQPIFILEEADFKIKTKSPIKNLRQEHLWSVSFTQLKILNLSNSQLLNIEGLSYCELPMLQRLQLQTNHITSIQVLSKCAFKSLKEISLFNNPLPAMNKIARLKCPKLQRMDIDEDKQRSFHFKFYLLKYPQWHAQTIDFIPKLQNVKGLTFLPISYKYRSQPKWYKLTMKKINPSMQIYTQGQKRIRKILRIRNEQAYRLNYEQFPLELDQINLVDGQNEQQPVNRRNIIEQIRQARNRRRENNHLQRIRMRGLQPQKKQ